MTNNPDTQTSPLTMKAYWQNFDDIVESSAPQPMTQREALNTFADMSGATGNFFGLIDNQDRTMQLYFEESIPDDVEDARHLRIVLLDFPIPNRKGSFSRLCTIGEASDLIKHVFAVGADPDKFDGVTFSPWG